jgi:hypothetical protein
VPFIIHPPRNKIKIPLIRGFKATVIIYHLSSNQEVQRPPLSGRLPKPLDISYDFLLNSIFQNAQKFDK